MSKLRRSPAAARAVLALFCAQFLVLDLALRGVRPWLDQPRLLLSGVQSLCLWALLALACRRIPVRIAVAALAASLIALQTLFFSRFGTLMDTEVVRSTIRFWADVKPNLSHHLPKLALLALALCVVEYLWLQAASAATCRSR